MCGVSATNEASTHHKMNTNVLFNTLGGICFGVECGDDEALGIHFGNDQGVIGDCIISLTIGGVMPVNTPLF